MTVIVAFVQTKGGVGKTTSAIYLASALSRRGTVELWDTDHQGSATEWADAAIEKNNPLPFEVRIMNRATIKRRSQSTEADFIVIDTPPGDPGTIDDVIAIADVVILPTEAAPMDMGRLWRTVEAIPTDKSRIAMLTKVNRQTIAYRDARELLEGSDQVALFAKSVPNKQLFKLSWGEPISDLHEYEEIAAELVEALQ